ncbi:MAG: hypothetical protein JKY43_09585 [Phycisphaerales bacterium]|nr:hypothetical protein [Phycisphaerales bacterium]
MDRINASQSIPNNHALRAYAQNLRVQKPLGAPGITRISPTTPAPQAAPAQRTGPIGRIGQAVAPRPAADPARLIAAKVNPINLSHDVATVATVAGPKPMMTSAGTYSMHPSAATRNTAATGVALGRGLDLKG